MLACNDVSTCKYCVPLFPFGREKVGKMLLGVTTPLHGNPQLFNICRFLNGHSHLHVTTLVDEVM